LQNRSLATAVSAGFTVLALCNYATVHIFNGKMLAKKVAFSHIPEVPGSSLGLDID
jgi:hypothetical protein